RGGVAAMPPCTAPGRAPPVTPAWPAELLRVIALAPPTVGVPSTHGTTGCLALSLAATTRMTVPAETVCCARRAADDVGKRPTWTRPRHAAAPPGSVGNASGGRWAWLGLAHRPLHPCLHGSQPICARPCRPRWQSAGPCCHPLLSLSR